MSLFGSDGGVLVFGSAAVRFQALLGMILFVVRVHIARVFGLRDVTDRVFCIIHNIPLVRYWLVSFSQLKYSVNVVLYRRACVILRVPIEDCAAPK